MIFWIRGTYPRLRIDQLMAFGWQLLVPMSFVNIILTAFVIFYDFPLWVLSILSASTLLITLYIIHLRPGSKSKSSARKIIPASELRKPESL